MSDNMYTFYVALNEILTFSGDKSTKKKTKLQPRQSLLPQKKASPTIGTLDFYHITKSKNQFIPFSVNIDNFH